jgi:chemotaxis protein CheZ
MSAATAANDSDDLQALFDSIAADQRRSVEPPKTAAANDDTGSSPDLVNRIGQMTRTLHESLRALGYDKTVEEAASAIPDARERLAYVATLTERAALRVMNATDIARPMQDKLGADAQALADRWRKVFAAQASVDEFKAVSTSTLAFLEQVPNQTQATSAQLTEIMLAQDFQDLTGQVIKRINDIVHLFEQELLKLLIEATPAERRPAGSDGLLNGPVVNAAKSGDVVTSQAQVDDLLESLGF